MEVDLRRFDATFHTENEPEKGLLFSTNARRALS